jgi:vancomycin permeability regulator SanA
MHEGDALPLDAHRNQNRYFFCNSERMEEFAITFSSTQEDRMTLKSILGAALLASVCVTPVLADFYIVREQGAKECRVVRERPSVQTTVVIGNKAYTSEEEARAQIKTVCVEH